MKYVFVAAMPKSGTTSVARLLDRIDGVAGQHEWIGTEPEDLRLPFLQLCWYAGRDFAVPYLERVRSYVESEFDAACFCDVGGNLQRAAPFLEEVFEPVAIFLLVRDPRDQVRSHYTHRTEEADRRGALLPRTGPEIERWIDGDKFTHICMQWAETTTELLDFGAHVLRLEELVSDYDYCRRELLDRSGLELSQAEWQDHVSSRVNAMPSKSYRFVRAKVRRRGFVAERLPPYEHWPAPRKEELMSICGETMQRVGYDPEHHGRTNASLSPASTA